VVPVFSAGSQAKQITKTDREKKSVR